MPAPQCDVHEGEAYSFFALSHPCETVGGDEEEEDEEDDDGEEGSAAEASRLSMRWAFAWAD